jgi:hypothetical protein
MSAAAVIQLAVQRMVCTGCGAEANASCNCGKTYVPAAVRAKEAISSNPGKSNRALAAEIGVDEKTVRNARTADDSAVERVGLDGKTRSLPKARPRRHRNPDFVEEPEDDVEADIEPDNYRTAYLLRADQARRFAVYSGPVTEEIAEYARVVIKAWTVLVEDLEYELRKKKRRVAPATTIGRRPGETS